MSTASSSHFSSAPAPADRRVPAATTAAAVAPVSPTQRTAEAKAAFIGSLHSVGANLDTELQTRATDVHANARALEKQDTNLRKETRESGRSSERLEREVGRMRRDFDRAVDVDDLDRLMESLGKELSVIEETLDHVEAGHEEWTEEEEDGEEQATGKGKGKARENTEHDVGEVVGGEGADLDEHGSEQCGLGKNEGMSQSGSSRVG